MKRQLSLLLLMGTLFLASCELIDIYYPDRGERQDTKISGLTFIGEQVIPDGELFEGEIIGGLSSIDYAGGIYYLISDAPNAPIRFYTASLSFDDATFSSVEILSQVELLDPEGNPFGDGQVDPEAIRFDEKTGHLIWTSEGYADDRGIDPFVRQCTPAGVYVREFNLPSVFQATDDTEQGPRNNGTFEGLTLSHNQRGFWVAMELPLIQDGPAPVFGMDTESPVRIAYIDRETGNFGRQYAYELDPVVRDGGFTVNGVVEILAYAPNRFLVLERSFATGYDDGGNNVLIYDVDARRATDVSGIAALNNAEYRPVRKRLLFDFESIRTELSAVPGSTANVVDNIEGMSFGPELPNGNRSLVLVADNNFSAFGAQLNQFVVLEVQP